MNKLWQKIFGNMKVFKKMLFIGVFSIISLILLGYLLLIEQERIVLNEKKDKLVDIIDLSYSLVAKEYNQYKLGLIDEQTAKKRAKDKIASLRYDDKNYIWINDETLPYPKMIMHPIDSFKNGKTMDSSSANRVIREDYKNGKSKNVVNKNLFQSIVHVVKNGGSGFVLYLKEKMVNGVKTEESFEKLSYVKEFKPWGWIFGTGIFIDDVESQFYDTAIYALTIILIIIVVLSAVFLLMTREIVTKVNLISNSLESFFAYLNRESDDIKIEHIVCKDEFGHMSKLINENIEKTKVGIEEDRLLIDETINVLGEFEQGDLCQRLNLNVSNPAMMKLKDVLNKMAENLEQNIDNVLDVLEKYTSFNYLDQVNTSGLKKDLYNLANGVNNLGDSITQMLIENKSNGLTLEKSSDLLLKNVSVLNDSSTESASSLEETAAAIEEITSNIRSNSESISTMSDLSNNVISSAKDGEELASHTVTAMDDINNEVTSISEAISVIDQIAFQTNILSLNAAVEAATAGEAGKGFAVVAQEVRNLAARSAEAAKEIKDLVENATLKANNGKFIADKMITGYENLNTNISKTMDLISNIEVSSKEQLTGIEQINDAINQLDQQTQNNASVAFQTNDIATSNDSIAKLIVNNANEKEFKGKNTVQAKKINNDKQETQIEKKAEKIENKNFTSISTDDSSWENF